MRREYVEKAVPVGRNRNSHRYRDSLPVFLSQIPYRKRDSRDDHDALHQPLEPSCSVRNQRGPDALKQIFGVRRKHKAVGEHIGCNLAVDVGCLKGSERAFPAWQPVFTFEKRLGEQTNGSSPSRILNQFEDSLEPGGSRSLQ